MTTEHDKRTGTDEFDAPLRDRTRQPVTIDGDVAAAATFWGEDPRLVQAIVDAEGGGAAIIRAVQCSVPSIQTRDKALDVVCRSLNHRRRDYIAQLGQNADFIAFFSIRWAPPNARNDPTHLNE